MRMLIDEKERTMKRFRASDYMGFEKDDVKPATITIKKEDNDKIIVDAITEDETQAKDLFMRIFKGKGATKEIFQWIIYKAPFKIEAYIDGNLAHTINDRNLFQFERSRDRSDTTKFHDASLFASDQTSLWEHSFDGHTDQIKYGPTSFGIDITFSSKNCRN
jgi:hypothetical protein